jgi:hypothetical protein
MVSRLRSAVTLSVAACTLVLLGCPGGAFSAPAPYRDYYVSPSGSDAGPGTRARPWRTLVKAVAALRPGRRVLVRAGTYKERVEVVRGGSKADPVAIAAYPGEHPVLVGRLRVSADHVRVAGLVLDGTGGAAFDSSLYIAGAQDVDVRGCEIRNAVGSGVFVGDRGNPSSNVVLVRNWIHDNGTDDFHDHGIYWAQGNGGLIGNNVIEKSAGFGVHLYPDANDVRVMYNTVVASGRSGIIVAGDERDESDRNLIVNNIVAFNGELGIRSSFDAKPGTGNVVRRNLLFGNTAGDLPSGRYAAGLSIKPDNRIANPQFVDRAGRNYRLSPSSPALDRADPAYTLAFDFTGKRRPSGKGPDIGAYEG